MISQACIRAACPISTTQLLRRMDKSQERQVTFGWPVTQMHDCCIKLTLDPKTRLRQWMFYSSNTVLLRSWGGEGLGSWARAECGARAGGGCCWNICLKETEGGAEAEGGQQTGSSRGWWQTMSVNWAIYVRMHVCVYVFILYCRSLMSGWVIGAQVDWQQEGMHRHSQTNTHGQRERRTGDKQETQWREGEAEQIAWRWLVLLGFVLKVNTFPLEWKLQIITLSHISGREPGGYPATSCWSHTCKCSVSLYGD